MKRTILKPFLLLTVLVGCSGLLTTTPQPVIAQVNSSVLLVQRSDELEEAEQLEQQAIELRQQGKYNKAIPITERVLEIRERLYGENHLNTAMSLYDLAELYFFQGRFNEAEFLYIRSLATIVRFFEGKDMNAVEYLNSMLYSGRNLHNLGTLYFVQKRYDQAELLFQRSLAIREKFPGDNRSDVAETLNSLGLLYFVQKRYDQAELLFQRSLAIREKALGENHPDVIKSLNNLVELYRSQGRYDEAESLTQRIQSIQTPASK